MAAPRQALRDGGSRHASPRAVSRGQTPGHGRCRPIRFVTRPFPLRTVLGEHGPGSAPWTWPASWIVRECAPPRPSPSEVTPMPFRKPKSRRLPRLFYGCGARIRTWTNRSSESAPASRVCALSVRPCGFAADRSGERRTRSIRRFPGVRCRFWAREPACAHSLGSQVALPRVASEDYVRRQLGSHRIPLQVGGSRSAYNAGWLPAAVHSLTVGWPVASTHKANVRCSAGERLGPSRLSRGAGAGRPPRAADAASDLAAPLRGDRLRRAAQG